jgi:N-acetylglucosamine repressor
LTGRVGFVIILLNTFNKVFNKVPHNSVKPTFQNLPVIHRLAVLRCISTKNTFTKLEVVSETHLSLPTVTSLLAGLQDEGYIHPVGNGESNGGRPPALYEFISSARYAIGVEIEIPFISIGLVDLQSRLIDQVDYPFCEETTSEFVMESLEAGISILLERNQLTENHLIGIGMGIPGYIEKQTGSWLGFLLLRNFRRIPVGELLTARFRTPVYLENEKNVYASAEMQRLPGHAPKDMLFVTCGSGVKASVVMEGRVFSGDNGNFGRVGHYTVVENGKPCYCGLKGCLEMYATGRGIREDLKNQGIQIDSIPDLDDPALANHIFRLAAAGDLACRQIVERVVPYMAKVFSVLVDLTDIRHLVLMGAYAEGGNYLTNLLYQHMTPRLPRVAGLTLSIQTGSRLSSGDLVKAAALPAIQAHLGLPLAANA